MASASTARSFGSYDETCAEEKGLLQKNYNINELKAVATKYKNLGELITYFEANPSMEAILKQKATKISFGEDAASEEDNTTDPEVEENYEVMDVVTQRKRQLATMEFLSFIHKLWLRRIRLTREEGNEGYGSFELAIHDAQESIKRYRDFIYKEFHNKGELREMDTQSLEEAINKVEQEKEKSGFEMIEEDIALFMRPTVGLCALLGLKLDFLDRLETFPEDHFYHRSICDWITIFLQNNSRSVSSERKTSLTAELLDSIGFDPLSKAVETIMARSSKGNMQCHIEPCEWAEIFIQDEFNYNPLLSPLVGKFPFQSDLTNSWFQLPKTNSENSESSLDPCHVNIMNLVTTESNALKDIHSKLDGFLSDWATVLYHGTDHQSAVDILFRGIHLSAGRQNRDFSCGPGFYLTKNLDEAVNWAASTTAKPAILIFHDVNLENLDGPKKLDLSNNQERWCEIVASFRSGRKTAETRKSLSAYDLVEGPQATMRFDEASHELLWKQKPSSYQMCLISDDFAEIFEKTLHSILLLEVSV